MEFQLIDEQCVNDNESNYKIPDLTRLLTLDFNEKEERILISVFKFFFLFLFCYIKKFTKTSTKKLKQTLYILIISLIIVQI